MNTTAGLRGKPFRAAFQRLNRPSTDEPPQNHCQAKAGKKNLRSSTTHSKAIGGHRWYTLLTHTYCKNLLPLASGLRIETVGWGLQRGQTTFVCRSLTNFLALFAARAAHHGIIEISRTRRLSALTAFTSRLTRTLMCTESALRWMNSTARAMPCGMWYLF